MTYKNERSTIKQIAMGEATLLDDGALDKADKDIYGMNSGEAFHPHKYAKSTGMTLTKISELPSGHHVYHTWHPDEPDLHTVYAWHPKDKTAHLTMSAISTENSEKLPKNLHVTMISTTDKSTLPAHHFYQHMINDHDTVFTGHAQTMGGFKIWQKLSESNGIHVRGFHPDENQFTGPIKLKDVNDTHVPYSTGDETSKKAKMLLVASKDNNNNPKVTPPGSF